MLYLIGVCFAIGGFDYAIGSPLGFGKKFEEGIRAMGAVGLGFEIIPLQQVMFVVGKIAFILAGAYPMLAMLERFFSNFFKKIGDRCGIDDISVVSLLGNLATNLLVFGNFKNMNNKGKVVCSAFAISGAFVFGGQMGFVSGVAPSMLVPFWCPNLLQGYLGLFWHFGLWDR
ncbi:ethanolamine utilization protein EutH [Thermoanaerobacterium thermosaccharolyticum]|uniref:Ethanolamine utilization protein n=2 Tax=Thermoanaerobacterium thermosaccharolyticum TaxID=1517 RepID=A0A223I2B4_THETR|nr:ethanolamine utilization protein EutH [Thermoanaerobacterium thermosaccharolyticum]AGB18661.1 ethanolamine utilization protein [Thermoanaerobacterium thermosaccharolyticum M0795]AST58655.1 ethanolamine utilization protein [Thermoanaerobacterium thermosaccharolyticum]